MFVIEIERRVQKSLSQISSVDRGKIISAISDLAVNPRPVGCKKLTGRDAWRIRIGSYRVIYEIIDKKLIIIIVDVGHRKDIYRNY